MTTNHHTPIPSGAAADDTTFNGPLSELDTEITAQDGRIGTLEGDMPVPSGSSTEYYDGDGNWTVPAGTGAGVDGHVIQDEGVDLVQRAKINFVGAGVTVTNEAGGTQVDIPGSSDSVTKDGLTDWDEQASDPSNPASGKWKLFFKASGLYIMDDAGAVVGPVTVDHGSMLGLADDDHPQYLQKTYVDTIIKGMGMIRNSGTSLSVDIGACYAENGNLINVTSILTASSLSLSNSTWYHVYVYLSVGSPAMEVVTTAPVAWKSGAYSKTGDTSRRYVGSVRTNGSGNIYKFFHNPQDNLILWAEPIASSMRVLNSGTATTSTSVSLASVVPSTSERAMIYVINLAAAIGVYLSTATDDITTIGGGMRIVFPFSVASQTIYYRNASGGGDTSIDVVGYYYKR